MPTRQSGLAQPLNLAEEQGTHPAHPRLSAAGNYTRLPKSKVGGVSHTLGTDLPPQAAQRIS